MRKGFCAERLLCGKVSVCVKAVLGKVSACKVSVCKNFFVQSVWASFSVSKFSCVKVSSCKSCSVQRFFCVKGSVCKSACVPLFMRVNASLRKASVYTNFCV